MVFGPTQSIYTLASFVCFSSTERKVKKAKIADYLMFEISATYRELGIIANEGPDAKQNSPAYFEQRTQRESNPQALLNKKPLPNAPQSKRKYIVRRELRGPRMGKGSPNLTFSIPVMTERIVLNRSAQNGAGPTGEPSEERGNPDQA